MLTTDHLGPWPAGFRLHAHFPAKIDENTQILVAVHGISRNAGEHFEVFRRGLPESVALICPEFSETEFAHFQRLNIGYDESRADLMLDALLARIASLYRLDCRRVHLFGFSGGAQFVHRYAMLNPHRIHSLHVASAGYYTFLQADQPWPRGCRGKTGSRILALQQHFLRLPISVYVGKRDTTRDCSLRAGPGVDLQQGTNRMHRAINWTDHLNERRPAGTPPVSLTLLPKCGHDFCQAAAAGGGRLLKQITEAVVNCRLPARQAIGL